MSKALFHIHLLKGSQWISTMSLNLLNTMQNLIITSGSLAGMLYCGSLVVQGKLTVCAIHILNFLRICMR